MKTAFLLPNARLCPAAFPKGNVLALAHNSEAGLFERLDRPEMINAGNFRHC
jgi:hypothetical protein